MLGILVKKEQEHSVQRIMHKTFQKGPHFLYESVEERTYREHSSSHAGLEESSESSVRLDLGSARVGK